VIALASPMAVKLAGGSGSGHARLVFWCLCSMPRKGRRCWPSNATISRRTGIDESGVERALALLADAGEIEIVHEQRAEKSHRGRTMLMRPDAPRLPWPSGEHVAALWALGRSVRTAGAHPSALVELAVCAWVVASIGVGSALADDQRLGVDMTQLQRLLGASRGGAWSTQLRELELAGVIVREGKTWRRGLIVVADLTSALERRQIDPATVASASLIPALRRMSERHGSPVVWPANARLAAMTNQSEASVRAGLLRLAEAGLVVTRSRLVGSRWRREILMVDSSPESAAECARWFTPAPAPEQDHGDDLDPSADDRWSDADYLAAIDREAAQYSETDESDDTDDTFDTFDTFDFSDETDDFSDARAA
jgi:predicted transcriptional regulator